MREKTGKDAKNDHRHRVNHAIFSRTVKRFFSILGLDVVRKKNTPSFTLLGLKKIPVRTVIDIGANRGQFARYISEIFPSARIFCFEPLPGPFAELQRWAERQGGRVVAVNTALGAEDGEITMIFHEDHPPSSSILRTTEMSGDLFPQTRKQREIRVSQKTLDGSVSPDDLEGPVLIKMDVQGYEDRVMAGGGMTFSRSHACITEVSLDNLYQGQAAFPDLYAKLAQLGYRYAGNMDQKYGPDGHCMYFDALFVRDAL